MINTFASPVIAASASSDSETRAEITASDRGTASVAAAAACGMLGTRRRCLTSPFGNALFQDSANLVGRIQAEQSSQRVAAVSVSPRLAAATPE